MTNIKFNPIERPYISKYQICAGISQLKRCEKMNDIRRKNSILLQEKLKDNKNIRIINDHLKKNWNHQYFVISIRQNFKDTFNKIFNSGIHVMDENVWDCTKYSFEIENINEEFINTKNFGETLIRVQNNSLLKREQIELIAQQINNATN